MSAHTRSCILSALLASPLFATTILCQAPAGPPLKDLGPPIAISEQIFSTGTTVRALPLGRLLVNDGRGRRIVMMDSMLKTSAVVLDTAMARSYGRQAGVLTRYLGDSSLFLDLGTNSRAALILDATGRVARVGAGISGFPMGSVPANWLIGNRFGYPDVDDRGRFVYYGPPSGSAIANVGNDSAFLMRWDVVKHTTDTVAVLRIPKTSRFAPATRADAPRRSQFIIDPLPFQDGWAVLADGGIAVVRARDYHVDWINADGSRASTGRLPFPWQKLTEDEKRHHVDSANAAAASVARLDYYWALISWANQWNQPYPADFTIPAGTVVPRMWKGVRLPAGFELPAEYVYQSSPPAPLTGETLIPRAPTLASWPPTPVLPLDEVADYWPPFLAGETRADADGNVWVRTLTRGAPGARATYDVVGRTGIVDRVRLRDGHTLVGFGPGGRVYTLVRDGVVQNLAVTRR